MATFPNSSTHANQQQQTHTQQRTQGSPYCSDPDCISCRQLREMQEAIRLHQPLPQK